MRGQGAPATPSARSEFVGGVKGVLPICLGVIPLGLIYGVLALSAGLPASAAQAMSSIVFAGSAQFVAAQLFKIGAPGMVLVLTTLIVNLRHLLYSASVAPYIKHLNGPWKALLAYLLTDEAYAVAITRYMAQPPIPSVREDTRQGNESAGPRRLGRWWGTHAHWHFLGAGLGLWTCWQISTAAGILLGAQIPPRWGLDFALALTFIALVVPTLKDRPSLAAGLCAGVVAVAAAAWPYRLGLMAAAVTGIIVGVWTDLHSAATAKSSPSGSAACAECSDSVAIDRR